MSARYLAVSGGVGGAKLCLGLADVLGPHLSIVVNTGDDFEHLGLAISPDIDTTLYTLSDRVNTDTGWGRRDETWTFMQAIRELGGPHWFRLGDGDLALHVERTRRLRAGERLTRITGDVARAFGIRAQVLPMSDTPVRTILETDAGTLGFQDYFVRLLAKPAVQALRFEGSDSARPPDAVRDALAHPDLAGIIVCPSNPWLSVDPILSVPGMRQALRSPGVPVVAVTPIIAGAAVKGPTAKIMAELGLAPSAPAVARHYEGLIDGFILDIQDARLAPEIALPTHVTQTLMLTREDKVALAKECLDFCAALGRRR